MQLGQQKVVFSYQWSLEADGAFSTPVAWLKEEFDRRQWQIASSSPQKVILKKLPEAPANKEYYCLEITSSGVVLSAATEDGMFRAVGRLLGILKNPEVEYGVTSFRVPELKIADWPDIPLRLMDLTMAFWEPFSAAERLDSTKKFIAVMAEHGFNAVVIELGGNYVSKHFKPHWANPWTEKDIREVVTFCRMRGVMPIPAINTIGHLARAPKIAVLKDKAGEEIGHNIVSDEFYTLYGKVLDELMDYFGNPRYCRVGGDESNAVFQTIGRSPEESEKLFARVFNFAAEHLAKYNSRPVIWHDMLFSLELGGKRVSHDGVSEQQVIIAPNILKLLDKRIVINYWNYLNGPYDGAKPLIDAGFEVWASTWQWPESIWRLACYAGKSKMHAYDGTTWCNNHTKGGVMVLVGEYAWNASRDRVKYDPDEVFMREWSAVPVFNNVASAKKMAFQNAVALKGGKRQSVNLGSLVIDITRPVAASSTRIMKLKRPEEAAELRRRNPKAELFMQGNERFVMQIPALNGPRLYNSFTLYTPSNGPTTKTNMWGEDWVLDSNCKVIGRTYRKPDMPIPADGGVISVNETGADIHMNVRKIMEPGKVTLLGSEFGKKGELPVLKAQAPAGTHVVAMVFASRLWMYTERPCTAAKIEVVSTDGSKDAYSLNVDFALAPDPHFFKNFDIVYLPAGLVAVIWRGDAKRNAAEVSVEFSPVGAAIGTMLMGAVTLEK